MYVDMELVLVTLVGLILRIDDVDLSSDPFSLGLQSLFPDGCGWLCTGTLYGDLLWIALVLTLVPIFVSVLYKSPEEKAQTLLYKIARAASDEHLATQFAVQKGRAGLPKSTAGTRPTAQIGIGVTAQISLILCGFL